ncbi:hypothetical protein B0H14DRAFT_2881358 [Mycena olivaceomarginata]|nr:hypothetical protein B0H14DRAFT_2881358 [Mycena olivaceomarginata]
MPWPHTLLLLLLAALPLPHPARANTEIANFAASERTDAPLLRARGWPALRPRSTTRWALARAPRGTPLVTVCAAVPASAESDSESQSQSEVGCPYEHWFALDLPEAAAAHARWTLRLSWDASTPTDFTLDVLDPRAAAALLLIPPEAGIALPPPTTRKYARIRAVDAGVRTPGAAWVPSAWRVLQWIAPAASSDADAKENDNAPEPVELHIALEPLLLGVLPAGLVPFLLVAAAVLGALLHPNGVLARVQRGVEGVVREARAELAVRDKEE